MGHRSLTAACSAGSAGSAGTASFSTTAAAGVSSTLGSPGGASSASVFCFMDFLVDSGKIVEEYIIMEREEGKGNCAWHNAASGSISLAFAREKTIMLGLTASKGHSHPQCSLCKLSQSYITSSQGISFLSYRKERWEWGEGTQFAQKFPRN